MSINERSNQKHIYKYYKTIDYNANEVIFTSYYTSPIQNNKRYGYNNYAGNKRHHVIK